MWLPRKDHEDGSAPPLVTLGSLLEGKPVSMTRAHTGPEERSGHLHHDLGRDSEPGPAEAVKHHQSLVKPISLGLSAVTAARGQSVAVHSLMYPMRSLEPGMNQKAGHKDREAHNPRRKG